MPKLWNATIETHRREVRDAILERTAALAAEEGLRAVTMGRIAEKTGIGRATLYKYFSGIEEILRAWHERKINHHLEYLAEVRDGSAEAGNRLGAVLEAYALLSGGSHGLHDAELVASLHGDEQVARARQQVRKIIRDLISEGVANDQVRSDISPDELTAFCVRALGAAPETHSRAAVRRLVGLVLAGLRSDASDETQVLHDG